jgi:hypothetical protein
MNGDSAVTLPKQLRLQRTGRELADLMIHMDPDTFSSDMIEAEITRLKVTLARLSAVAHERAAEETGGGALDTRSTLVIDLDAYATAILRLLVAIELDRANDRKLPDANYTKAIERITAQLDPYMSAPQAGNVLVARAKEHTKGGGA